MMTSLSTASIRTAGSDARASASSGVLQRIGVKFMSFTIARIMSSSGSSSSTISTDSPRPITQASSVCVVACSGLRDLGRKIWNSVRAPIEDVTVMKPRFCATMPCTVDNPRPVP